MHRALSATGGRFDRHRTIPSENSPPIETFSWSVAAGLTHGSAIDRSEIVAIRTGRANPIEFGLSRFVLVLTDDRVERRFFGRADTILPALESLGWPIERNHASANRRS